MSVVICGRWYCSRRWFKLLVCGRSRIQGNLRKQQLSPNNRGSISCYHTLASLLQADQRVSPGADVGLRASQRHFAVSPSMSSSQCLRRLAANSRPASLLHRASRTPRCQLRASPPGLRTVANHYASLSQPSLTPQSRSASLLLLLRGLHLTANRKPLYITQSRQFSLSSRYNGMSSFPKRRHSHRLTDV